MKVKPSQIQLFQDGSVWVDGISWSGWGTTHATGTGTMHVNDCKPDCAQGTYNEYPATVTLTALKSYGDGLEAYSSIVAQGAGTDRGGTFTTMTVP